MIAFSIKGVEVDEHSQGKGKKKNEPLLKSHTSHLM